MNFCSKCGGALLEDHVCQPAPSGETRGTRTFQQADCPKCKARITVEVLGLVKPLAPEATTKPGFYANPNTTLHDMFPLTTPPDPVAPGEAVGRETVTMSVSAFAELLCRAEKAESELSTLRRDRDQLREKNRDFNRRNQALTHAVNVQSERGRWHAYYLAAIGLFDDAENKNAELESQVRELTAQRDKLQTTLDAFKKAVSNETL